LTLSHKTDLNSSSSSTHPPQGRENTNFNSKKMQQNPKMPKDVQIKLLETVGDDSGEGSKEEQTM
jgi:hypothetical protein